MIGFGNVKTGFVRDLCVNGLLIKSLMLKLRVWNGFLLNLEFRMAFFKNSLMNYGGEGSETLLRCKDFVNALEILYKFR